MYPFLCIPHVVPVFVIACVRFVLVHSERQAGNCYETAGVTEAMTVNYSNGRLPVPNEPQYAPINSTIRDRTVSQHYEVENGPVLNPMYRVRDN